MENVFDDELIGMVNYTDETVPAEMPVMECKAKEVPQKCEEMKPERAIPQSPAATAPFAQGSLNGYNGQRKQRDIMDRLKSCATWGMICGGIAMLMWWFEVNGLMAMEAAYPCILGCAAVGSFGIGANFHK